MDPSVGVVLPAYHPNTERLCRYVRAIDERLSPAEIRIELDDAAPETCGALASLPATVNAVDARRGKGAAITAGFEALDTDVLTFADADASTPVDSFADVVGAVTTEGHDFATGSRRHPEATIASHQTFARRRLGDGFAWLARRVLDVSLYDYQCGAKAITREAWTDTRGHLYEPGFAWDIELVAVVDALGYSVAEVPVVWEDQPGSTVSPVGTTLRMARGLLISRQRSERIRHARLHRLLPDEPNAPLAERRRPDADD